MSALAATHHGSPVQLAVAPAFAIRGSLLSVIVSDLGPHRTATISLNASLTRFRTSNRGVWSGRVRVPSGTRAGTYLLRVTSGPHQLVTGRVAISATRPARSSEFVALATGQQLTADPADPAAGTSMTLTASGFARRQQLTVWLDNRRVAKPQVTRWGRLRLSLPIPSGESARPHQFTIVFGRSQLVLSLAVRKARRKHSGSAAPPPAADPVVDAVGDSVCSPSDPNYDAGNGVPGAVYPAHNCLQKAVSNLVVNPIPSALLDLGDNQYDNGERVNYQTAYNASFGRANAVVYPSLGNAEYANTAGSTAAGFFGYFGPDTGVLTRIADDGGNNTNLDPGGYYSFNLGAWHIIALNSNCSNISGGCGIGSPEETWLEADLVAHPGVCTLAYWHHSRWNSGTLGNNSATAAFWTDLYAAHADVVLGGHANHHYERFLPQDDLGNPTPAGVREFNVSTGGQSHGVPPTAPGDPTTSVLTNYTTYGILQLTLHPTRYDWHFIPANGTFTDTGTASCHL